MSTYKVKTFLYIALK